MMLDYKCPICEELLVDYMVESGNKIIDGPGAPVVEQGDPRKNPSATIRCGNGCSVAVKGRDRVAKLLVMIGAPTL